MKRFTMTCVALLVLLGVAAIDAHATDSLTLVLTNEAPGYLIDRLVDGGYGDKSPYEVVQYLHGVVGEVIPSSFVAALAAAPPGSEVKTTPLHYFRVNYPICFNDDGTMSVEPIYGRDYDGRAGYSTTEHEATAAGRFAVVSATTSEYYIDAGTGDVGGDPRRYRAFAVVWAPAQTGPVDVRGFVLSNELGPEREGGLIDQLIAAGHGSDNLYQILQLLAAQSDSGIPADFVTEVGSTPPGSEVYTAALSNFSGLNGPVCINADGTLSVNGILGRDYDGQTGFVTNTVQYPGVGPAKLTMATSPAFYIDAGTSAGGGGSTHYYKAIGIAWAGASVPASSQLFPGVASSSGSGGTTWRSEAVLVNPGTAAQTATLDLIPRDGAAVLKTATRTVQAGQLLRIADLYADLGAASGAGMLRVSGELLTWVRTFNQGVAGTFGQDVPPAALADAFAASTDVLFPVTTPADQTKEYRSNLLLVNLESAPITFTLTAGTKTATKIVPGGTYTQIDKVGTFLKLPTGLAVLAVRATGRWAGTVSTVDPGSGDPTTVRGLLPTTRTVVLFPGVASVAGSLSTQWRSEAVLYNAGAAAKTVLLEILPKDGSTVAASTSLQLQPKEVRRLADLYAELHAAGGSGLLRVTGNVLAWVRTYNQGASATFGQDVPPVLPAGGIEASSEVLFPVSKPGDKAKEFRSNLILYNHGTAKLTCTVTAGTKSRTTDVPAGAYAQVNDVGTWLGVPAGWTTIAVKANGRWSGTVSTIDPFTGDPTTVVGIAR